MTTIGERIHARRRSLKLKQSELADRCGVHRITVCTWESGRAEPDRHALVLAEALGVSVHWLLTGAEASDLVREFGIVPPKDAPPAAVKAPAAESALTEEKILRGAALERREMPEMHPLPVVSSIAANAMPTFAEARETQLVEVKYARANHYCLLVKGQSMKPTIMEGDVVIVQKCYYHLEELLDEVGPADKRLWKGLNREVVCASVNDDDPVIKRMIVYDRKDTGFHIHLRGDNPTADEIEILRDTRLKIFGVVKQIMRDPKYVL